MNILGLTRSEIRANRQKWIDYLMQPDTKKATGRLERDDDARCCLGHACHVLGLERSVITNDMRAKEYFYDRHAVFAPKAVVNQMGLWDDLGSVEEDEDSSFKGLPGKRTDIQTLSTLNDDTMLTPQQIGEYLLSVIEGGTDTPFRPLDEYPE